MGNRKKRKTRSGVATVEFAFVAPIFFLLVFGLIEMGRMMMIQQSLTNAAREGCRTAVLATTKDGADVEEDMRDYLQSVMSNASNTGEVRITVPPDLASVTSGAILTVSVEVDYLDASWLPLGYLGLNPTIGASQIGIRE
jgi:Flp pilus assembly protein TadG